MASRRLFRAACAAVPFGLGACGDDAHIIPQPSLDASQTAPPDACGFEPAVRATATWSPSAPSEARPPSRAFSSLAVLGDELILFGGGTLLSGALNDTWRRSLAADDGWTTSPAMSPEPSPRVGQGLVASGSELLLVGGQAQNPLADTWRWATTGWSGVCSEANPCAAHPSARFGHALAFDGQRGVVVLVGGHDRTRALNDVWEWTSDLGWIAAETSDCVGDAGPCGAPPPRYNHALAYDSDRGRMLLFAGDGEGGSDAALWEHDGSSWARVTTSGDGPSERAGHVMAYLHDERVMVVYGGVNAGTLAADDLWVYSPRHREWVQPDVLGERPSPRAFASAAYDSARNRLVVFGGGLGGELADLWFLQLATENPRERCECLLDCSEACGSSPSCEASCAARRAGPGFDCAGPVARVDAGAGPSVFAGDASIGSFDLVLSAIDDPDVDCAFGECVTTAEVVVSNAGLAASPEFSVTAILDDVLEAYSLPQQPLAAGEARRVLVVSEPGPDCLDPECDICASAIAGGDAEPDNDTLCQSFSRSIEGG